MLTWSRASPIWRAMAIRPLLILPDPRLRLISAPIDRIDHSVKRLVEDLFETMYAAPGIGLAAVQIGEMRRVLTIDVAREGQPKQPLALINPEIVAISDETSTYNEGCLSIPEYYEEVERPTWINVRYLDLDGAVVELKADGLLATCIQHEIDHLNGVLFIDHLSKLKRDRVTKKFIKAARQNAG